VREPSPGLAGGATLTYRAPATLDLQRLALQHAGYRGALARSGYDVLELPPLPLHPDGVFTEDLGIAFPELVVWGRTETASRRGELDATLRNAGDVLVQALAGPAGAEREVHRIGPPGTLDGGDVLTVGRTVLVGISGRTNRRAADQLTRILGAYGYRVRPVPVHGALHLKTACTAVSPDSLLVNPGWVALESLSGYRVLAVDGTEPFGANVLPLGDAKLLVSASAPRTAERLRSLGFDPVTLDISEFERAEGGLTCLSLRVPPSGSG
jgi:dimethylargininase